MSNSGRPHSFHTVSAFIIMSFGGSENVPESNLLRRIENELRALPNGPARITYRWIDMKRHIDIIDDYRVALRAEP